MTISNKRSRVSGPLEMTLGALTAAAILGGCSGRHATETARPDPARSVAIAAPSLPGSGTPAAPVPPPTSGETRTAWREGGTLFEPGDLAGASARLKLAAEGRSAEPYVQYLLGLSLWKSDDLEGARLALERASTLEPGSIRTWINLARVRLQGGDFQGALQAADSALAIEPGSADALHQRGRALTGLKRGDEALVTLTRAQQAEPGNGYVSNTLGYLLIQMGRPAEAVPFLEAAREKLPRLAYVRNNLGVAYERLGRRPEALDEFRAAVDAGDSEGKAAASLARIEAPDRNPATTAEGELGTQDGTPVALDVPVTQDQNSHSPPLRRDRAIRARRPTPGAEQSDRKS